MKSKKSGQILILVLLIVVVSLAVGLSVASRNLTNLKISTQTEQSQRAFSAAEGGVEDVLSRLNTIKQDSQVLESGGLDVPVDVGDIRATVNVKGRNVYETVDPIPLGEIAQINLVVNPSTGTKYSGNVTVEWLKNDDPYSAIELTFICEGSGSYDCAGSTVSGTYSQNRLAFSSDNRPPSEPEPQGFVVCPNSPCSSAGTTYKWKWSFNTGGNVRLMRIKSFDKPVRVRVSGEIANPLPTQIYEINYVAKTEIGITRKVQVTRTVLPALPAVFDYVLYSEGDIVK